MSNLKKLGFSILAAVLLFLVMGLIVFFAVLADPSVMDRVSQLIPALAGLFVVIVLFIFLFGEE